MKTFIAAVKPPPAPHPRGRPTKREERRRTPTSSPRRSTSKSRLLDWGKKGYHCGEDHSRKDCVKFKEMMRKANPGVPESQWKPPKGYKSAIGRARDAAKKVAGTAAKKIGSFTEDDTASERDSITDGEDIPSFSCKAITRVQSVVKSNGEAYFANQSGRVCTLNRFNDLPDPQEYDPEELTPTSPFVDEG